MNGAHEQDVKLYTNYREWWLLKIPIWPWVNPALWVEGKPNFPKEYNLNSFKKPFLHGITT